MKNTLKLPLLIGVAGGTSCGKSTIVERIIENLNANAKQSGRQIDIVHLSLHSFYRELSAEEKILAREGKFNFDHPDQINFDLLAETLQNMIDGKTVEIPKYDMITSSMNGTVTVEPAKVIIIEGILLLYDERVRKLLSTKLFVEKNAESRLRNRLATYIRDYHRAPLSIIRQYTEFVKPAFEEFCRPTKKYADVIIPRGADNHVATDLIAKNLQFFRRHFVK
ncbi:uridine/cytidine kinase [Caenorhabditis elegans]|uniref:uridine/cytidine kinase n=1 Tax=Caenorhabditis elegans TaxID=6239 RepID=A0A3P6N643_CAEEL|nr:uridine/cytidine kinase [Caenorhabditis elegans]VDJ63865.1 uridine/cytidine kinase [Caenorhabditis elegans]|eukprot:NP_001355517.1 Probable uridine-cytidine kinase [Caenorhabditis elegans]